MEMRQMGEKLRVDANRTKYKWLTAGNILTSDCPITVSKPALDQLQSDKIWYDWTRR